MFCNEDPMDLQDIPSESKGKTYKWGPVWLQKCSYLGFSYIMYFTSVIFLPPMSRFHSPSQLLAYLPVMHSASLSHYNGTHHSLRQASQYSSLWSSSSLSLPTVLTPNPYISHHISGAWWTGGLWVSDINPDSRLSILLPISSPTSSLSPLPDLIQTSCHSFWYLTCLSTFPTQVNNKRNRLICPWYLAVNFRLPLWHPTFSLNLFPQDGLFYAPKYVDCSISGMSAWMVTDISQEIPCF